MSLARERELFEACLELDQGNRARLLDRECSDANERARIEALLAAHARAPEEPPSLLEQAASLVEARIGPYRLLERIGEGGTGEVYLAEQSEPVRRRVALKVLRAGMDSREVLARFDLERQTLALMEHPNVARILDAGSTPASQPYVVMEYVPGVPITRYCDEARLGVEERLGLFVSVCAGVQHAHQRGIIHRDLKPSNILVTELDGKPVPKIIDFGIAKATTPQLGIAQPHTRLGHLVGTPDYMSPEQAELSPLDIDTRADVYALGVVLNELLTGALPYRRTGTDVSSPLAIARSVAEREPVEPSRQVLSAHKTATAPADDRGLKRKSLAARLRGDLDRIVMKALERDRRRRYDSPAELANDIERHLNDEPISARPPGAWYVVCKFARRHRLLTTAATVALGSLTIFGVLMAVQAQHIARERDRAEREAATSQQVSRFLIDLFQVSDPDRSRGADITARELLDKAAADLGVGLGDQPLIQARLETSIGEIYFNLAAYEEALAHYRHAATTLAKTAEPSNHDLLSARRGLARTLATLGRVDEAEPIALDVLERVDRYYGQDDPLYVDTLNDLGGVRYRQGQYRQSLEYFERAWRGRARVYGDDAVPTAISLTNLAVQQSILGEYEAAERAYLEIIEKLGGSVGDDHPQVLVARNNLATLYSDMGRREESLEVRRELLPVMRRVLGPDHDHTLTLVANLGASLDGLGRHQEAVELFEEVVAGLEEALGSDHTLTLYWQSVLAYSLDTVGQHDAARELIEATLARATQLRAPQHSDILQIHYMHAELLHRWERYEEALAELDPLVAPMIASRGLGSPRAQNVLLSIAENALALGREEIAIGRLRQAQAGGNDFSDLAGYPRVESLRDSGRLRTMIGSSAE